jgi:hypothetical protein
MVVPPAILVLIIALIIALGLAYVLRSSRRSTSQLLDLAEEFYHLMNYNGLPMTRETAKMEVRDPANADILTAILQASSADRARWRERISLIDHRWIDDAGGDVQQATEAMGRWADEHVRPQE